MIDLNIYYTDFMQEIYARSGAKSDFNETVFTERLCEFLVDQATIENYSYVGFKKVSKGIRVDAWDYNEETEWLTLIITDFRASKDIESLTQTEIDKQFHRVENFFRESLTPAFFNSLEESAPAYELARLISESKRSISRVNFFLLSNASLSKRVSDFEKKEAGPYKSSYNIWDISRLYRIETSGKEREDIIVDFSEVPGGGIPCLPASDDAEDYESYLFVMPGDIVSDLYERYGERLLEQNVRTFLQFRGNVNKGIRNTIENEPGMFFAYNNGLTATAEGIEIKNGSNRIKSLRNFQIVNGGQTTASIYTSRKKNNADLSRIHVQVKLSIIPSDEVNLVVPKISEYANTQNRVSAADFFSNHPYHLRIEEMSRRIWAPSPDGGLRETHWFYERARGQYANAQATLTPAQKNEFLLINPRFQMFTKTDLAKFEFSVDMKPNIVSMGAQKNFAQFANVIGRDWEKNNNSYNELYYQRIIAKAIIFRFLDRNLMKQDWYGGYKANIVTYTVAKFVNLVQSAGKKIDFERIWKQQSLSSEIEGQLLVIAKAVNQKIQNPPDMYTNVTEWCKKELCWEGIKDLPIKLDDSVLEQMLDSDEVIDREKVAEKRQRIDTGINSQAYVIEKGVDYWKKIALFGMEKELLSEREMGILTVACEYPNKIPTEKQSAVIREIEKSMEEEGFYDK